MSTSPKALDARHGRPAMYPRRLQKQQWIEGGMIIAFWGTIALLTIGRNVLDPHGQGNLRTGEALQTLLEYGVWAAVTPGIFWLSRRFSLERGQWPQHLVLHVFAGVVISVSVDLIDHISWNALVPDASPRSVSLTGVLNGFHFLPDFFLFLIVLAAGFARDYFLRYRERLEETLRLRTEAAELRLNAAELNAQLTEARIQALRMQINPHFLFNTLHAISTYIERDPHGARRMIARLSELLRHTLEMGNIKEVSLRQELNFLNGYLEIQKIRFQDRLTIDRQIDPDALEALVPNLILQPLVENAIQHGVSKLYGQGRLELRAWRAGERLHLSVRDNGPGFPEAAGDGAPLSQGIGLRNTRERLESLYGKEQGLALEPADGGGVVAHISLPYHTAADLFTTAV